MKSDGEYPAFPCDNGGRGEAPWQSGMTLRQYIATAAMQGFASQMMLPQNKPLGHKVPTHCAQWAVAFADALIKELDK